MAVNITLTSSMRSNLSSLKSLASQMSTTQTRLSTGKKVNSAIDNANSYYQSRALTNRASDLDMLLDAMGQSIQTVTSAVHGLEKSAEMLENAAVIAKEAYEAAIIPEKAWFEAQVGPNGAVVTTAQELRDAINANKEMICVYGKIDLGEITSGLTLKANQKLVGIGYFGDFDSETEKWSSISGVITDSGAINMVTASSGSYIADVTLKASSARNNASISVVYAGNMELHNVDICINNLRTYDDARYDFIGISKGNSIVTISGNSTVRSTGNSHRSMLLRGGYSGGYKKAFVVTDNSRLRLLNGDINIYDSQLNIGKNSVVYSSSKSSLYNSTYIAHIDLQEPSSKFIASKNSIISSHTYLAMAQGAELTARGKTYKANEDFTEIKACSANNVFSGSFLAKVTQLDDDTEYSQYTRDTTNSKAKQMLPELNKIATQYTEMMTAYDEMVADSGYQGVNLIKGGKLTTMFNEDRTHSYTINGKDMSSNNIGIVTREWVTKDDIAQSIKEIQNAMSSIRDEVSRLGNSLSIIETRMDFTDAMCDVLQTGADDLVLADMNEESANYLALQTRNNLAVNALALAAQSNNAVLKLF